MFPVVKSVLAPTSLAKKKSYREKDVIDALVRDFHNKCYICEIKEPIFFNVEHFRPHEGDEIKKYDWNNLFFACSRCNNIKGNKYNDILNCTNPQLDVLGEIRHVFPTTAYSEHVEICATSSNPATLSTAELISKVFNESDTGNKDIARRSLKKKLMNQYRKFLELTLLYDNDDSLPEEKEMAVRKIKNMLKTEYEFSAFLRWAIIDAPSLHHFRSGVF